MHFKNALFHQTTSNNIVHFKIMHSGFFFLNLLWVEIIQVNIVILTLVLFPKLVGIGQTHSFRWLLYSLQK